MSIEVRAFQATIPAGTPQNAPVAFDCQFPSRVVNKLEITIPPGPNGTVGFMLTTGGMQVIPINPGGWVVASGERIDWDLTGQITTGAWFLTAYNVGIYPHTLYLRFLLDLVPAGAVQQFTDIIPVAQITGNTGTLVAGSLPEMPS